MSILNVRLLFGLIFLITGCKFEPIQSAQSLPSDEIPADEIPAQKGCSDQTEVIVLILGNSYSGSNNLVETFSQLACSAGIKTQTTLFQKGGYNFLQHAVDVDLAAVLNSKVWDIVIMQNQSVAGGWPLANASFWDVPLQSLQDDILYNNPNAKIFLFMTWSHPNGFSDGCLNIATSYCTFDGYTAALVNSYNHYKSVINASIAPVGLAFKYVRDNAGSPVAVSELFADEGGHPSRLGTYLLASTLVTRVFQVNLSSSQFNDRLPAEKADYLREISFQYKDY